jgi:hypothetical protein
MRRAFPALLLAFTLLAAACGGGTATTAEASLELAGPGGTVTLDMDGLEDLPVTEGWGGFVSSTGTITIPERYQGVSLADLAARVGGVEEGIGLTVVAKDGYAMTLSYDQAINGAFIAYDPSTGAEITPSGPLYPIVAYARDGEPLGEDEGPLRLQVVSDERDQVVDGHWTVKWVTAIEIKELGAEWTLEISGLTDESMDRGTFESGANCHQASWTDGEGRVYTGIPLWLLAGRLDGGPSHGDDSYDDALAEAGYSIEVVAADGYRATIESSLFHRNDAVIVANQVDGAALLEDEFPLRLVGEGLTGGQKVSQVIALVGVFAGETGDPGEGGQAVPGGDAYLAITGAVATEVTLSAADLGEFEVVEVTVEHPRDGNRDYTGVRLGELLASAGPAAGAVTLVLTASDGYAVRVGLADALACPDCLAAFGEEGFNLAMPALEISAWVKDVVSIEVQ